MITWDDAKRESNLRKHGLDFADAWLVLEAPDVLVLRSPRSGEERRLAIADVAGAGLMLAVVYVERGPDHRIISFRRASRRERRLYAEAPFQN